MKTTVLVFALFLCAGCSTDQTTSQNDEEQLRQLIQGSFDEIFSALDTASIQKFYTTDFLLLEHGEVWDNERIAEYMQRAGNAENRPVRTNRFEFIEVKVSNNTAWLAYQNYATLTQENGEKRELYWLESATALRTPEGWRLEMLHSTRVEQE